MSLYYDEFANDDLHVVGLEGLVPASGVGYAAELLAQIPEEVDRGLSSGNPFDGISIPAGAVVLDLGCGTGRDCLIARGMVGESGRVVGLDESAAMLQEAQRLSAGFGYENVAFHCGSVLDLPFADASMGFVISNCVFNQIENKHAAFAQVARVLEPGGVFSFSDVMKTPEASPRLARSKTLCLARAVLVQDYLDALLDVGFSSARLQEARPWPTYRGVVSAHIIAVR